jgi:hypothetical protein
MSTNNKKPMNNPLEEKPPPGQQEAMNRLAGLFKGKTPAHEPIIKSLEKLGVNPKVMPIMLGDEAIDCLVIPVDLLMMKEYQYMSGIDIEAIHEKANMVRQPLREEQENEDQLIQPGTDSGQPK